MKTDEICCRKIIELKEQGSPWREIIALGYYDGPTSGLAKCRLCSSVYKFDLLTWDDRQDVRIYAFSPLPASAFQQAIDALAPLGAPTWPVWVPIWQVPAEERAVIDGRISNLLGQAGMIKFVIASEHLAKGIMSAKLLTESESALVSSGKPIDNDDWFTLLGLTRD